MPIPAVIINTVTNYTVVNITIILCSFIESYLFPFSVIKWLIILTKYGCNLKLIPNGDSKKIQRYNYSLKFLTSVKKPENDSVDVFSHVNIVSECVNDCLKIQLSYCGQECYKIPPALCKMYGLKATYLDLSFNSIETLKGLEKFRRLEELILDNNQIEDNATFPYLPELKTFSINNNQIKDLESFLIKIRNNFPSLTYLSMLSNKACPNQLSDNEKDDADYQRYRYFVIHTIPNLKFLDSRRIDRVERIEALKRGEFMRVRRIMLSEMEDKSSKIPGRPLAVDFGALGKHRSAYGKCNYKYTGKHSEGNRFIGNNDL